MANKRSIFNDPSQFEPLMPNKNGELEELAYELIKTSAGLANQLPAATLEGVRELLRITNSYYSNMIEGNNTHPIEVERAMRKDYSAESAKRDRQIESTIHIEVQRKIDSALKTDPKLRVTGAGFLRWIHRQFYEQMPEALRQIGGDKGRPAEVKAGEFRTRQVAVGHHLPPVTESIDRFLQRFDVFYDPDKFGGITGLIAISASHHRLMWIHPFLDGNGRVARLFTDAFFQRVGLSGYGLWNVSRGLARKNAEYKQYLNAADFFRESELDGRGNLSNRTLTEFCNFFLEVSIDQAAFMTSAMRLDNFLPRLEGYTKRRAERLIVDDKGVAAEPLHPRAGTILREAAIQGELSRGAAAEIIAMSERSTSAIIRSLIDEGLLVPSSGWHRSSLRLGFPPHAAGYWFPNLFPLYIEN